MATWLTSANSFIIDIGKHFEVPLTIAVDPGTGNVQVQFLNSAGVWTTPPDEAFTISEFGVYELPRANVPSAKVIATGNAKYSIHRR